MTEAELWNVFMGFTDIVQASTTLLISVIFAFLIVVYFAGEKLTRLQLTIITSVYSAFSLIQLSALMNGFLRLNEFAREIEQVAHSVPNKAVSPSRFRAIILNTAPEHSWQRSIVISLSSFTVATSLAKG